MLWKIAKDRIIRWPLLVTVSVVAFALTLWFIKSFDVLNFTIVL